MQDGKIVHNNTEDVVQCVYFLSFFFFHSRKAKVKGTYLNYIRFLLSWK